MPSSHVAVAIRPTNCGQMQYPRGVCRHKFVISVVSVISVISVMLECDRVLLLIKVPFGPLGADGLVGRQSGRVR